MDIKEQYKKAANDQKEYEKLRQERLLNEERDRANNKIDMTNLVLPKPEDQAFKTVLHIVSLMNQPEMPITITKELSELIPLHRQSLTLIAAVSGHGKSLFTANIAYSFWKQKRKILLITNEEIAAAAYLRIASIEKGIGYGTLFKGKAKPEEALELAEIQAEIARYVTVLDQEFHNSEMVTSEDGIKAILTMPGLEQYDAIVIDYFQNITTNTRNQSKGELEILASLAIFLNERRNNLKIPIVVLAQLWDRDNNRKTFETRLKSRRKIYDVATNAIELVKEGKSYSTSWHRREKGRDLGPGIPVSTGYIREKAKIVPLDDPEYASLLYKWVAEDQAKQVKANGLRPLLGEPNE